MLGAVFTTSSDANADSAEVSGTGKGIAGGALLGAEIGFLSLAAAGSKNSTLYYTIPPALAVGGGVAGYFIEKNADAHVPVYMLAAGMAFIIPTIVITLSATHYSPVSEDGTPVDATPATAPAAPAASGGASIGVGGGTTTTTPPAPAKRKPETTSLRSRPFPVALLNVSNETVALGVPMVGVKPMYTRNEVSLYGVSQKYEVHAPVVALSF
ncbi:MAG: hypothetical protein ACXVEF_37325 [Polyangiales bacterium]